MTESGWGSNVNPVSAPSITLRCPTWTPSKLPIATVRARGSASLSFVTLMFMDSGAPALLNHVGAVGQARAHGSTTSVTCGWP